MIISANELKLPNSFHVFKHYVIPENIHTSPMEGIFSKTPPPLWKFQLSFIHVHFFKCFGLTKPPTPQEIPIPSVGRVWIFSGTAQWVPNPALELRVGWGGSAYPAGFSSFCILFFLHQNKGKSGRPQSTTDNELQS